VSIINKFFKVDKKRKFVLKVVDSSARRAVACALSKCSVVTFRQLYSKVKHLTAVYTDDYYITWAVGVNQVNNVSFISPDEST